MNINLHIERLVLDGVVLEPGQHHLLQHTITSELTRMLTEEGLSPGLTQGASVRRLYGERIHFRENNNPAQLGLEVAQSVYGGIGHE